jgi:hypothetical protein
MKAVKLSLVIMAVALLTIGLSGMAYAFHDGGVAYCEGCHTMHNSVGGVKAASHGYSGQAAQYSGNQFLLIGTDQSSTCLFCHSGATLSSYHVMTTGTLTGVGPANYTPGGDFAWLTKSYPAASDLHSSAVPGERHGHNVIAADFSLLHDNTLTIAPGGSYSRDNLSCVSCHDPHSSARINASGAVVYRGAAGTSTGPIMGSGSSGAVPTGTDMVGVYRLLGGNGYLPKSYVGGPAFGTDPPFAVAPSSYNRKETSTDTRVAYGKGMSEWCSNCHTQTHNNGIATNLIHPASDAATLPATIVANYNMYLKSGDFTNTQATSYTSMVPFEEGSNDRGFLLTQTSKTTGPSTTTENVMCLTCHRAHASGFRSMTRWNNDSEFITEAGAYLVSATPGTMNAVEYQAAMYDRPASNYATYQRSLCNKCHAKD